MSKQPLPVSHYEEKLLRKFRKSYKIFPVERWNGLKTDVNILCCIHKTNRLITLKKVFNGKNSMVACRLCYLESLKHD